MSVRSVVFWLLLVAIALWLRRRLRVPASGATIADRAADPYETLGVGPDASPDEITRAYREQMKLYHPDRVAGLGEDLQEVAHRKTLEIQRAYETIGKR